MKGGRGACRGLGGPRELIGCKRGEWEKTDLFQGSQRAPYVRNYSARKRARKLSWGGGSPLKSSRSSYDPEGKLIEGGITGTPGKGLPGMKI